GKIISKNRSGAEDLFAPVPRVTGFAKQIYHPTYVHWFITKTHNRIKETIKPIVCRVTKGIALKYHIPYIAQKHMRELPLPPVQVTKIDKVSAAADVIKVMQGLTPKFKGSSVSANTGYDFRKRAMHIVHAAAILNPTPQKSRQPSWNSWNRYQRQ